MRERVDLKSPVRENRPPGSVRGAPGNRRPYRDFSAKFVALGQALVSFRAGVTPVALIRSAPGDHDLH